MNNNQEARQKINREYGSLYGQLLEILFRYDPGRVNYEVNPDEYEPEVDLILPQLKECSSAGDVASLVRRVIVQMFSSAGPLSEYEELSREIWQAWQQRSKPTAG